MARSLCTSSSAVRGLGTCEEPQDFWEVKLCAYLAERSQTLESWSATLADNRIKVSGGTNEQKSAVEGAVAAG